MKIFLITLASLSLFALPATAAAQSNTTGFIFGHVATEGAGPIGKARVTITHLKTGLSQEAIVREDGRFRFSALPVGDYSIRVEAEGFQPSEKSDLTVRVGTGTPVAFDLANLGKEFVELEEVTVVGQRVAMIDVSSPETATNFNAETIDRLPVIRDVEAVALLAPGTTENSRFGLTFGGASAGENAYFINGMDGVEALASGRISALNYCNAALAQADKFRLYNIFSQTGTGYTRNTARAVDAKRVEGAVTGALEGLPYALKDSVDMVEFYTIAGHPSLKTFRPKVDAELVSVLKEADAVCIGKTQIPPLSMWWTTENPMTGDTGNPFNQAYKTGGSSGGSGAAVAARIVPFAIAEDTGGSVRIPAAMNGVLGLRPTTGRWPSAGAVPIGFSDTLGPIARTAADIRLLDSLLASDGPHGTGRPVDVGDLRIGYQATDFLTGVHPWVENNFEATVDALDKAGATFVELSGIESQKMYDLAIPLLLSEYPDAIARYFARHGVYDRSAFELLHALPDGVIKESWVQPAVNAPTGEDRYTLVRQLLGLRAAATDIIESSGVDVFMYPSSKVPNTRNDGPKVMEQQGPLGRTLSELEIGTNMFFAPAMKAPSMTMFSGMDPDGLPLSVTFDAASGADRRLLDIAEALEMVLPPLEEPESI